MSKLWQDIADFTRDIKIFAVEKNDFDSAILLCDDLKKFLLFAKQKETAEVKG